MNQILGVYGEAAWLCGCFVWASLAEHLAVHQVIVRGCTWSGLHGCALCHLSLLCGSVWWLLCLPAACLLHVLHAAVTDWEGGGKLSTLLLLFPTLVVRVPVVVAQLQAYVESPTNALVPFCDGCHCSAAFAPSCLLKWSPCCVPSVMPSCRRCLRDQAQRPVGEREPVSAAQPRTRRGGLRVWQASLSMFSTLRCAAVCRMHPSSRRVVDACMCWALRKCRCSFYPAPQLLHLRHESCTVIRRQRTSEQACKVQ